jgi:hypothetical protein
VLLDSGMHCIVRRTAICQPLIPVLLGKSPETTTRIPSIFTALSHVLKSSQINLLKPIGYVMHQRFNIQQLYSLPTLYVFCIYLRTNSDFFPIQHKLIGIYNRDEKCLLRGMNWVLKAVCASSLKGSCNIQSVKFIRVEYHCGR